MEQKPEEWRPSFMQPPQPRRLSQWEIDERDEEVRLWRIQREAERSASIVPIDDYDD